MTIFDDWPNQWFGLFRDPSDTFLKVPVFSEIVDADWNPPDLLQLAAYLDSGLVSLMTASGKPWHCHLCGQSFKNNSVQMSDGTWVWPFYLGHYVQHHHVRLPDRFVERIRDRGYSVELRAGPTN